MFKNNKGLTLIEALVAMSILFMTATTIIPLFNLLHREEYVIHQRRQFANSLHDELETALIKDQSIFPNHYTVLKDHTTLSYRFTYKDDLVKGCVQWENVKKNEEKICLYGYPTE